jgi:hypothetical protein
MCNKFLNKSQNYSFEVASASDILKAGQFIHMFKRGDTQTHARTHARTHAYKLRVGIMVVT